MRTSVFVMALMVAIVDSEEVLEGGAVELGGAGKLGRAMELGQVIGTEHLDVRWSSRELMIHRNRTVGCRGRCSLQSDGALRFTHAQLQDSGQYRQEVFNQAGKLMSKRDFTLTVQKVSLIDSPTSVQGWVTRSKGWTPLGLSLVLLCTLTILFIRGMRVHSGTNQSRSTDSHCLEENLYVPMFKAKHQMTQGQDPTVSQARTETEEDVYV